MADSDLSASELRKRYHRGGTAADDELSAAQLRARHGIAPNKAGMPCFVIVQYIECFLAVLL